jgi:hypothetical protein
MPPRRAFFAFHRLFGQNSIIAKVFPDCPFLSHVQTEFAEALRYRRRGRDSGVGGYSNFNALHSGRDNDEVQLMAFDELATDGKVRSAAVDAQSRSC